MKHLFGRGSGIALVAALHATAVLTADCASAARSSAPAPAPNVLLIISDDQAWSDYSFMGHPAVATPNLDRLAKESVTFHRGYTPVPLCRPSLASIATGLYPHQHGVTGNDPDLPDPAANAMASRANPKFSPYYETIVENFRRQPNFVRDLTTCGYVALQTGKWWEGDPVKTAGFTHAMTEGDGKGSRHGDAGLAIGRQGLEPIYRFIADAGAKPFLVWYAPMLPHAPHNPPGELLAKYRPLAPTEPVARYWACVEWFDRGCGDLLNYLQAGNLRENTIVIYTTDNGWIQDPNKANQFAARSKQTAYEGGLRTPIMVSWKGTLKPRMDREHLASNLDIWPTLAALLGTPVPDGLPGINLTDRKALAKRHRIFGEQYTHNIADVNEPAASLVRRWTIDGWWKLHLPAASGTEPELYNLRRDPWETNNLATRESGRARRLARAVEDWWQPDKALAKPAGTSRQPAATTSPLAKTNPLVREFIYERAPFPSCHASTIAETAEGLVAAWFGGQHEKAPDVGIWVSRREQETWTPPMEVATGIQPDGRRHPCWNPVLFQPKNGPLLLFYKVGPSPSTWWGMLRTSQDQGRTWTDGRRLREGILGPIKNKPVQLANGDLLCPSSTESGNGANRWRVHFERTSDLGEAWTTVHPAPAPGGEELNAIQPSILFHTASRLQAIGRSREQRLFETWSEDGGATWGPLTKTAVPNPNAGTDAVTLQDGRHVLVYNPTTRGRTPLSVAVSRDGKEWQDAFVLETEPGEYSYPAVIQSADGKINITYTWKREKIRHVVLDPQRL